MNKELHIYMYTPKDIVCYVSYNDTERAIYSDESIIHTTQIHFCQNRFIYENGYAIYIHEGNGKIIKIDKTGTDATTREIREGHNLEKMLLSGEFSLRRII